MWETKASRSGRLLASSVALMVGVALVAGSPALATDGVIEINQTCAVNSGCTSGDSAGLPVTPQGTSFVLTSDLILPDANTNGINLPANSSLDMNGFAIRGPVTCSGVPSTCSGTGTGNGIVLGASSAVRNGTVSGAGNHGVLVAVNAEIENVAAIANGVHGIGGGNVFGVKLLNSRLHLNGNSGSRTDGEEWLVKNCSFRGNNQYGMRIFQGNLIISNVFANNGLFGLTSIGTSAWGLNSLFNNNSGGTQNQTPNSVQLSTNFCATTGAPGIC